MRALRALRLAACWSAVLAIGLRFACAQSPQTQPESNALTIEQEVRGNILNQRIGTHSVADLNLPRAYVDRIADRIIRSSFEERYRIVVDDAPAGNRGGEKRTENHDKSEPVSLMPGWRNQLKEARPPMPGYRAAIFDQASSPWPFEVPEKALDVVKQAADMVGKRLAIDGLLLTTAQAIEIIGPERILEDRAAAIALLRDAGLPVDLLAYFHPPEFSRSGDVVEYFAEILKGGRSSATFGPEIESCTFKFVPTRQGFQVATESGETDIGTVRLQMTRGTYWECEGDGGNLDVMRQLIKQLPDADFIISVERRFLDELGPHLDSLGHMSRLAIEDLPVSQWAQDNGKPGLIVNPTDQAVTPALIVPRFASRGEDGSMFVPGDTFLLEEVSAAPLGGLDVFQSPLLFQGGNLLAVRNPKSGERLLLVGEGEVYRNMALGLSEAQVLAAMRIEFGVDRVIKLPAVSFHIDFELTVRAHDGKLIAFVLDTPAAARLIVEAAMNFMAKAGMIDPKVAAIAREHLQNDRLHDALAICAEAIWSHADADGRFPLSFAKQFSAGPGDSGVGNLQRILLALDLLVSRSQDIGSLGLDPHAEAYLKSFVRREADRMALRELLAAEGMEVVLVPGLSDGNRGLNPLNGLHAPGRYLMPAYGGLFTPVDAAAGAVFSKRLGPDVQIFPILTSETQRRAGGLHCSASVMPKTGPTN